MKRPTVPAKAAVLGFVVLGWLVTGPAADAAPKDKVQVHNSDFHRRAAGATMKE